MKKSLTLYFVMFLLTVIFSLNIVTTINPYYLLVKDIVQDKAKVSLLIKPGANPHVYSLKISDAKVLNGADLIIANGYLEPYLKKYKNVIYISDFVPKLFIEQDNPHFWLDPFFTKYYIIPSIVKKLSELDSANRTFYESNSKKLIKKINNFILDSFNVFKNVKGKILVQHPSFYYYFKEFGIETYWIEKGHNTSSSIKELLNIIKTKNITAIFSEVQQPKTEIEIIANELGKKYFVLDPLGIDTTTFIELYYKNLNEIRKAVSYE
ncbi:metal ABC transporter substrate-binding protein [Thermosipho atlanticus]|uniref:Zinc transport system substrate-binding protein n=1 Tax=Thermosipho atlanticus DSM 15807 TaxID=1123380 RepID=A0A1M5SZF5_9BACT|nr:metal ABC transporter substrate-binding protein [Thermosipho atlanticus]SHH43907.1 zinc transport system substrate-binding protein [Thermosipho atlanticus DSM 15807]